MQKLVPILVTWDTDPTLEVTIENKRAAFRQIRCLLRAQQVRSTFFFPARMAEFLNREVEDLLQEGHEIGCHGLTHDDNEDYSRMSEQVQQENLGEATRVLRRLVGSPVHSFRGPHLKTSPATQGILTELGYTADCSVASQRIDFVSSNLINPGWIVAPRLPYRPDHRSVFRRGQRNLWVIPVSALVVPFIASALYVFRTRVLKGLFRVLYWESRRTGKPIVYLVHTFDFVPWTDTWKPEGLSLLQSIRTHGFLVREKFYEKDPEEKFQMNLELIEYMKSFPGVQFQTVRDYVVGTLEPGRNLSPGDAIRLTEL